MRSASLRGRFARPLLTVVLVVIGVVAAKWLWVYYQIDPWTRDARVRVDVADVAPDVSGLVFEVDVVDNMPVHKGQRLFVIDRPRFELALQQTLAALQQATAGLSRSRGPGPNDPAGASPP